METEKKKMIKLYSAESLIELDGYREVPMHWLTKREKPVVVFADTIIDYKPADCSYTEMFVNELFTYDEIIQVKSYFEKFYDDDTFTFKEETLPIADGEYGYSACDACSSYEFLMMHMNEKYNLDFELYGCYQKYSGINIAAEKRREFDEKLKRAFEREDKDEVFIMAREYFASERNSLIWDSELV